MILESLIAEFRRVMQDGQVPYLWTDDEICLYLTDAVKESCERALLIEDSTTVAVCAIALAIGTSTYPLHPTVLGIKRLTVDGVKIDESSIEELDGCDPNWQNQTGKPTRFVRMGDNAVLFYPTPDKIASAALTVYRLPLADLTMDDTDAEPEIRPQHHMRLMPWVYRCALLKQDAETLDKAKAAEYEGMFTQSFGERINAAVKRKQRDRRPPIVSMGAW